MTSSLAPLLWLIGFVPLLSAAMTAAVIWLAVSLTRQAQANLQSQLSSSASAASASAQWQTASMQSTQELLAQQTAKMIERLSSQQQESLQTLQSTQAALMTATLARMSTMQEQTMSSLSSQQTALAELLKTATVALASKDAMTFGAVAGQTPDFGQPIPGEPGASPYTSVEDLAQQDAERAAEQALADQAVAEAMGKIQDFGGFLGTGTAGDSYA